MKELGGLWGLDEVWEEVLKRWGFNLEWKACRGYKQCSVRVRSEDVNLHPDIE